MREWTLGEVIALLVTLEHAELEQGTVVIACDLEGTKTVAIKPGQTLLNVEDRERPKLMKRVELAVRWEEKGCVYSMPYTSFEAMVDRGEIAKISKGLEEELGQQLATEKMEGDEPEEMAVGPGAEELPPQQGNERENGAWVPDCAVL